MFIEVIFKDGQIYVQAEDDDGQVVDSQSLREMIAEELVFGDLTLEDRRAFANALRACADEVIASIPAQTEPEPQKGNL